MLLLQAFCEVESGIPSAEIGLLFNGVPLTDNTKTLKDFGIKDGDMVIMDRIRQQRPAPTRPAPTGGAPSWDFSQIQVPSTLRGGAGPSQPRPQAAARDQNDPAVIKEMLAANPDQLAMLKQNNPRLAEAYASGAYLTDLLKGPSDREAVARLAEKVSALTGLDPETVRRQAGPCSSHQVTSNAAPAYAAAAQLA